MYMYISFSHSLSLSLSLYIYTYTLFCDILMKYLFLSNYKGIDID